MADFSSLKQTIQAYIKQNGNEEITGNILQDVLLALVSTMGDSAINSLASALQDETTARQNQDGTLQSNITAEATARQQADTALGGRIDGLQTAINGINTKLAEGYIYAGIATPSTNPGTPSGKVFYIAVSSGTYTNFSNFIVAQGINILKYNGSVWSKDVVYAIDARPKKASQNLVTSGGVFDNIGALDVSELNATENPHTLAQYIDLSAALAAIPTDYQKGGMSIKFVQSSDNKYVQYRLLTENFNTYLYNWIRDDNSSCVSLFYSSSENGIRSNNTEVGQVATLTQYTSTSYRHLILNIGEGVEFEISSEGNSNRPAILFLDKDNKILEGSVFTSSGYNYATGKITTPTGCVKMVVNWIVASLINPYLYLNVIDYVKYNCSNAELILNNNNKILAVSNSHYIRIPTPFSICIGQELIEVADNENHYVELTKEGSSNFGIVCYDKAQGKLRMVGADVFTTTNLVLFSFNETTKKLSIPSEMWLYNNKKPDENIEFSYLVGSSLVDDVNIQVQGTSLIIVFPSKNLRLYDKYGAYIVANTSGLTFTVNSLQALVITKSTLDVSVININAVTEEHIVLFRYGLSSMDGLLASFLLKHIEKAGFIDYTDFIKESNGITVGSTIGGTASMNVYKSDTYKHLIFKAKQGTQIYYNAIANGNRCPIAFVNETTKEILTGSIVGSNYLYTMGVYTAPSDCLVVLNVLVAYHYQLLIKTLNNELLNEYIIAKASGYENTIKVFSNDHYIRFSDLSFVERSDSKVYGVYQLSKGDKVVTKASGTRYTCIFVECNQDGSVLKNVIATGQLKNTELNVYEYIADHDCYILLSPTNDLDYIHIYRGYEAVSFELNFANENLMKSREKLDAVRENSDLTLAHFSDIHDDGISVDSIMALLDKDNFVDDVIHTGDSVSGRFYQGIPSLASAYNWNKVLNVVGNHDGAVEEEGSPIVWNGVPVKDVYDLLFAPYISNWGVTQPTDAATNGYCYYYKDYSEKIRLIVLNESYWDATQKTWFKSVLADAKTNDLAVVAIKHSKLNDMTEIDCNFNNKINPSEGMFAVDEARAAVDDFISSGGTFLCWLAGHGHRDNVLKYVNNNRLQLVILVTAAGQVSSDIVKKKSTAYGTSFNIVGFDMARHIIKIGRIGADTDNCMRKCDCMCIDYTTGDVVYSK